MEPEDFSTILISLVFPMLNSDEIVSWPEIACIESSVEITSILNDCKSFRMLIQVSEDGL